MINTLSIENYKSIVDLSLNLSHFNVFVGENGSGKSNILEALCLTGAATLNQLDNERLIARGVKLTSPKLMFSALSSLSHSEQIVLKVSSGVAHKSYVLQNSGNINNSWHLQDELQQQSLSKYSDLIQELKTPDLAQSRKMQLLFDAEQLLKGLPIADGLLEFEQGISPFNDLSQFKIYSPESSRLRSGYDENFSEPVGLQGQGTLQLIKKLQSNEECFRDLCESLSAFEGFEEIDEINDEHIVIRDYYVNTVINQQNMSDGFLFVLFCLGLVISPNTPSVFAIDHLDTALNPKLCTKLAEEIAKLAKKYNKQVFATTHNPGVLDGIDLASDDERLFVVSRGRQGQTKVKRISVDQKPISASGESLKLSEAFLRGYLGGLPKGF